MSGKQEIKCPSCKKWSLWNGDINDRCTHCGRFLDRDAFTNIVEKKIRKQIKTESDWAIIKPEDNRYTVLLKRFIQFFNRMLHYLQIAFLAFISFILWLISLLAA